MTHETCIVYKRRWRDLLLKTFWVRCWSCDLRLGPMTSPEVALPTARYHNNQPCPGHDE